MSRLMFISDGVPQLVLSDFGCCLSDQQNGLKILYTTDAISKEGNMALMAPEVGLKDD